MYQNYVFDLYATLVRVRTDQTKRSLWRKTAAIYKEAGAMWKPEEMQQAYLKMTAEEEQRLCRELSIDYPEADLTIVFRRLYDEAPGHIIGKHPAPDTDSWVIKTMQDFRYESRVILDCYHDTHQVLQKLKDSGKNIYLLTNAQAVFTQPEIDELDLRQYFDEIRISSDYHMKKPQPEFLQRLLDDHLMVPEKTVMIGNDIKSDIRIADACGIDSFYLNTWRLSDEETSLLLKKETVSPDRVRIIRSGRLSKLLSTE